jgi:hypothetical protein
MNHELFPTKGNNPESFGTQWEGLESSLEVGVISKFEAG